MNNESHTLLAEMTEAAFELVKSNYRYSKKLPFDEMKPDMAKITALLWSLPIDLKFMNVILNRTVGDIFSFNNRMYYQIGLELKESEHIKNNPPFKIGINIKTLEVFHIGKYVMRYVNDSLNNFVECMKVFNRQINLDTFQIHNYLPREEQNRIETELKTALNQVEPKCVQGKDREYWWLSTIQVLLYFHLGGFAEHSGDFK
jgi:hypothetical protein